MEQQRVAVVTGANKGLGRALVRLLCRTFGPNDVVYLTARDEARGLATLAQLAEEGHAPRFHLLDLAK